MSDSADKQNDLQNKPFEAKNKRFKEVVFRRAENLAELQREGHSIHEASKMLNINPRTAFYAKNAYPDLFMTIHTKVSPIRIRHLQKERSKIEIHDPPAIIPEPEGVTRKPWVELERNQCQWSLDTDFFVKESNTFPCCGLPTEKGKPFCDYHNKFLKRGWKDET